MSSPHISFLSTTSYRRFLSLLFGLCCLLAFASSYLSCCSAQSTVHLPVQQGALTNGVPAAVSLTQGDLHSWTFLVSPSDLLTGSALLDLVFALAASDSSQQTAELYVVDPSGVRHNSAPFGSAGYGGFVFVNRSLGAGDAGSIEYGVYLLQVYGVSTSNYTLSVSMARRTQLTATVPTPAGGIGSAPSSLTLHTVTYADYVVATAGSVQMDVTVTVDNEALLKHGVNLSTVILPVLYWSKGADVPAWSPTIGSFMWSTLPVNGSGQPTPLLYSLASAYDDCVVPPCRYSFAVVPVMSLPVLPLLTVTPTALTAGYDESLNYMRVTPPGSGNVTNATISTQWTSLAAAGVRYYQFPFFAYQNTINLTLTASLPSTHLAILVSKLVDYPVVSSAQWQLTHSGQSSTLLITALDPYFVGAYQRVSMEGSYQLAVVAPTGGNYQLTLSVSDALKTSLPLLRSNETLTGDLHSTDTVYFRFVPPPACTALHGSREIEFMVYNAYLYISDYSPLVGATAAYGVNNIINGGAFSTKTGLNDATVRPQAGVDFAPAYYIALSLSRYTRDINTTYTISAYCAPHPVLAVNSTLHSTKLPLLSGQIRYFDLYQPPLTSLHLSFTLSIADATQFGNLYLNVADMDSASEYTYPGYPSPNSDGLVWGNLWSMVGNSSLPQTGVQSAAFKYDCTAAYRCTWKFALYAPLPQQLLDYSLAVQQLSIAPVTAAAIRLSPSTPLNISVAFGQLLPFSFTVPANTSVQLEVRWMDPARAVSMGVSRYSSILQRGGGEFPVGSSTGTTGWRYCNVRFDPTSDPFYDSRATNVGSPFPGVYYARVFFASGSDTAAVNATITLGFAPFTRDVPAREPLPLIADTPHYQAVQAAKIACFSFVTPAALSASSDVVLSVWPELFSFTQPVSISLWWSVTNRFPSDLSSRNGSLSGAPSQSVVWSSTDSTSLPPSQTVYVCALTATRTNFFHIMVSYRQQRLTLNMASGTATTGWQGAVPTGYLGIVDVVVPAATAASSVSFIAGLVVDRSHNTSVVNLPPWLLGNDVFNSAGVPTLARMSTDVGAYIWSGRGTYFLGDFKAVNADSSCNVIAGVGCVYHFMAFFPQGANDWQLASNLTVSTAASPLPIFSTTIAPNTTIESAYVGAGQVAIYHVTVPTLWLALFTLRVTLTPLDGGNPDLVLTSGGLLPVLGASLRRVSTGHRESVNVTGVDAIVTGERDAAFGGYQPGFHSPLHQIGVTGTTAARYSLQVVTTGSEPPMPLAGTITLSQQTTSASLFVNQTGRTSDQPFVYAITVASEVFVSPTTELLINAYVGSLDMSNSYSRRQVSPTVYSSYPLFNSSSTYLLPSLASSSYEGAAVVVSTRSKVKLSSSTTYYVTVQVYADTNNSYNLVVSLNDCVPVALGRVVHSSLVAGATASYSLTLPARKVDGSFYTALSFTAAVSSLDTSGASPAHYFYMTLPNTVNATSPSPWQVSSYTWRSARQREGSSQLLTVADICTIATCTWTAVVYALTPNTSYSFSFAPVSTYQKLVPGLTHYGSVAANEVSYWTFSLPHPQMRVNISLQSLRHHADGLASAAANADLFVSRRWSFPDSRLNDATSQLDKEDGMDFVSLNFLNATNTTYLDGYANTTYYVTVFGQRAANYTLTVVAEDPGQSATLISNNKLTYGLVTPGTADYYRVSVASLLLASNLSVLLSTNCSACTPQLYATFSYPHPGPLVFAGQRYLPSSLPYESFALHSATIKHTQYSQLTLAHMPVLGNNNISPAQTESSLYIAVCAADSESGATAMPYELMVAGEQWFSLAVGSSFTTAEVAADTQHRYMFSFTAVSTPGQQALLVLTGVHSPASLLPTVYVTDPSISAVADPDISSPSSYTTAMLPSSSSSSASFGCLQSILAADCSAFPAYSSCLYKALVLVTSPLPAYSIALTTFNDERNDQQQLSTNRSVQQSVAAGSFVFFAVDVTSDVLALNVTLLTTSPDGNANLFVSTVTKHPNAASADNSQWSTGMDAVNQPEMISVQRSDVSWKVGMWYVSVFGQRAADFTLTLSLESTAAPTPVQPDDAMEASSKTVVLAIALSIAAVSCPLLALVYCYRTKRGLWNPARSNRSRVGISQEPLVDMAGMYDRE